MELQSPLLGLPGELRNRIYKFVAAGNQPVNIKHCGTVRSVEEMGGEFENTRDVEAIDIHKAGNYAGLTRVCRQIREEYLPIYRQYARESIEYKDLEQWSKMLEENHPIKELHVHLPDIVDRSARHVNWLPLLRAQAISISPQALESDRFHVRVYLNDEEPKLIWIIDGRRNRRHTMAFQELLDYQNESWMRMLRESHCPLEKVILGFFGCDMQLVFAADQKHLVVERKGSERRLVLEDEGFVHDCLSDLLSLYWWTIGVTHPLYHPGPTRQAMSPLCFFLEKD